MEESQTRLVKYVYLDVVGFTRNRSVEAQTHIINALNNIVKESVAGESIDKNELLFLPAGDGMGIALLGQGLAYDLHLKLALSILERVHKHNVSIQDSMRRFQIRVGVNENVDNIITDINGSMNVAGDGINAAQRVMSVGDGGQLIVGNMVYETLTHREQYMNSFRRYHPKIKHGVTIPVFQFIEEGRPGLSTEVPSQFKKPTVEERRLTELEAYYLAHAIKNREFFTRQSRMGGQREYAITVLLWFLAKDSVESAHCPEYETPSLKVFGKGTVSLEEAFKYYMSLDFWVCCELAASILDELSSIEPSIERSRSTSQYFIINQQGKLKLKEQYPDIWNQFELEGIV